MERAYNRTNLKINYLTMKHGLNMFFICLVPFIIGCKNPCLKEYNGLYKESAEVTIDGRVDKEEWKDSNQEQDFTFPWQDIKAPTTAFYSKVDAEQLYFAFQVADKNVVIIDSNEELAVAAGDRVEIFFAQNKSLQEYYCLEISPNGKVLDYKASFHRKFDNSWNCPSLKIEANLTSDGYIVEGSIPLEVLENLGIYNRNRGEPCFLMGLYRGEFSHTTTNKVKEEWISWIKPDTKEADFHVPSSFGCYCIQSISSEKL
jgi:hypothetical protein